jgi:SAM-dependent methyltransferase
MRDNKSPKKWDYQNIWDDLGEDYKIVGPSSRHTRRMIREFMKRISYQSIIDVGCGTGLLLNSLDLEDKKFGGIDISISGINICNKRFKDGFFETMDISKEIPDDHFDLCICSEVLEHIQDDVKAIDNLRKVCSNIIITVPCGKYSRTDHDMGHYRRYSVGNLLGKLGSAGFKVIKYEKWGFPFYSPIYRFFLDRTTVKQRSGNVTASKRIISGVFYLLFYINIKNLGDRLFVLAE